MIRALHLATALDFGGVEKHMELIARHAIGDVDHRFAAVAGGGVTGATIGNAGKAVTTLEVNPYRNPLKALWAVHALLRRERPHVLHCHGAEANLFGLPVALLAKVPVRIGEEIGMPAHGQKAKAAFGAVFRAAHRVIGVSQAVSEWLITSGEVPLRKSLTVYNPVAFANGQANARRSGESLRIGFVGRLDPVKNPLALISAIALLRERGVKVRLTLIGDGSQRGEAEALVSSYGLGDAVDLLGFRKDPGAELLRCHLYVQPSLSEGLGIAIIEALGIGLPVIATAVGGAPEIIDHGRTGWLVGTTTAEALAEAIIIAEALPGHRLASMGRAAMAEVRARFAITTYLETIEALYLELLEEHP